MTNTMVAPARVLTAASAAQLAESLLDAFELGDGAPVCSPVLAEDDAELLAEALNEVLRGEVPARTVRFVWPAGVAGVCLVVTF